MLGGASRRRGGVGLDGRLERVDDAATLVANAATTMRESLPAAVQAVTGPVVTAVERAAHGAARPTTCSRPASCTSARPTTTEPIVRWVTGIEPRMSPDHRETRPGPAPGRGRRPGDRRRRLRPRDRVSACRCTGPTRGDVGLVVTGLYEPVDPASPVWSTAPTCSTAQSAARPPPSSAAPAFLLSDASLPDMMLAIQSRAVITVYRFPADPTGLRATRRPSRRGARSRRSSPCPSR